MEYLKGSTTAAKLQDTRMSGGWEEQQQQQAAEVTLKMMQAWLGEKIILIMLISKRPAENWVSVGRQQW